jgi:hypothetical protein
LRAVVCRAEASLPLDGSVSPQAPISFSAAMSGRSSLFCSSDASRPVTAQHLQEKRALLHPYTACLIATADDSPQSSAVAILCTLGPSRYRRRMGTWQRTESSTHAMKLTNKIVDGARTKGDHGDVHRSCDIPWHTPCIAYVTGVQVNGNGRPANDWVPRLGSFWTLGK